MKHYLAILGWTLGVWLTINISFSLSFPGVAPAVMGRSHSPSGHSSFTEWLVMWGPMGAGALAFALGLLGLLPGTDPKDDQDSQN